MVSESEAWHVALTQPYGAHRFSWWNDAVFINISKFKREPTQQVKHPKFLHKNYRLTQCNAKA